MKKINRVIDNNSEMVYPHIVKRAFLHSGKETKIIKEMYGDEFESLSPNRNKYLTFLKRVEDDGRIKELNDILVNIVNVRRSEIKNMYN